MANGSLPSVSLSSSSCSPVAIRLSDAPPLSSIGRDAGPGADPDDWGGVGGGADDGGGGGV